MAIEASLNFKGYDIIKVVFDKPLGFSEDNFNINVNHLIQVDKENKNLFNSEFIVTISNEKKDFNLIVQTIGHFEIMGDVDQKVYDNYINISSPSIVYPYIRAFITNLVIQTGMKPIIIPPLNFAIKPAALEEKENI
jgi:preprotein translocase subunit SecB